MKKAMTLLLAGAISISMLAGCAGKENTNSTGKTDLLIGLPGGSAVTDMRVVDNFKAARADKYNIETDESSWDDFVKKVKLQMAAKNDVTPVFFTDSANATAFAAHGALLDLSTYAEALNKEDYTAALTAVSDADGKLWGVPHAVNSIALLYNKDIFDEKGVDYPTEAWTFQDMLDAAEKLTFDRNGDGQTDVSGIYYLNNITQGWFPFMQAYGVKPLTEDYRNSNLEDPLVRKALEAFAHCAANGYLPNDAEIAAKGGINAAFAQGEVAMYIAQFSNVPQINNFNPELNYDAAIMPIGWNGERTCIYVPNVWVIYQNTEKAVADAAWDWISYYLSEEAQLLQAETTLSGFPVMQKALDKVSTNGKKPEGKDAFYRGIDAHGTTIMENPCSTDVNNLINAFCTRLRTGDIGVEEGIGEYHTQLQETLDYFYGQLEA